ncbi:MAG TPA: DUF3857 domain-containing protein, partial [Anaeromyxobacteraceae bacterium]|nr:DUF3857 domain-containing protein [Anaeromyxobacteraceae bacterium]
WRDLPPEAVVDGFVHLGAALRPAREVVAYALAVLDAPRDERVQLWFGGSGAAKVWVNGARALADPGYHPPRLDQAGAAVTLRKGANRILVKLCHQDGRMGFYLRLADERGEPRTPTPQEGSPLPPAPPPGEAPARIEGAVAKLEARASALARDRGAAARRAEAQARLDLAAALGERLSADVREHRPLVEVRRAVELAPDWVEARLRAVAEEEEHGRRRVHLDAAAAVSPGEPRVVLALAREELDQGRAVEAVRLASRAAALAPGWAEPPALLARAWDRAGMQARAARAAEDAAERFPTSPAAVEEAARMARRLARLDQAALLLRKLVALRFDDPQARGTLARLLLERGDVEGFVAVERESLRLDPSDVALRLQLGDVLAANGRADEAEEAYAAALRIAPDEADGWERRGRTRLAAGRAREALADLQKALELRPQNPQLKEIVRSLEPERERFERPYLADGRALAAAAPGLAPDEDALVLSEVKVTKVFPSGLSSTFEQVVVKIGTRRGADEFRQRTIGYVPDRQEIKIQRARVLGRDGGSTETYDESEQSASEPWYRLYYDTRARTLRFPSLEPGDVLELAWRVDDVAGENLLSDYFGDVTFLDGGERKLRVDYVLLVPQERPIHANAPPGVAHAARALPGGVVEHRWSAKDLPRIDAEPAMPGWSEVARYVHVSTYGDWEQVGRFYWGLVRDQLRPSEEVRATANRIAAPVLEARAAARGGKAGRNGGNGAGSAGRGALSDETALALVKAVYDFVVSQTRYVGLEFGIHGFKPYRVDQVLSRRFGDCKDKASLMHALLESLGIDSRIVLLRMRRLGRMPEAPASLAVFNHAILYVPRFDLWLDGTAAYSGSRDLPGEDRGATVLVVNPDAPARFGYVPEATPADNLVASEFQIALAADGSAEVKGASRIAGTSAPGYRRAYQTENDRRAVLEQAFNRTFPGLEVRTLGMSDLGRIEDDVAMKFEMAVPRYARHYDGGLVFTPFGEASGYTESYASLGSRRFDLILGDPVQNRFTYRYTLPEGWAAVEVPEAAVADTPFGGYEVRYRAEGPALVAEGHVTFKSARVSTRDYAAFREFVASLDRAFGRKVRIAPRAQETAR